MTVQYEGPQYNQRMDGESSCTLCGAVVRNTAVHTKWHLELTEFLAKALGLK